MVAKSLARVLALLLLVPSAAFALGLGDIRLLSSLNAPLDAEIELIGATPEEMQGLKAQVASRDTFARYGLEWAPALSNVTVTPMHTSDGRALIKLRSTESMTEPFLTVLIEANWARGRLVREYTMLLDPPVYTPGAAAPAVIAAPVTAAPHSREGAIERAPSPRSQERAPASATPQPSTAAAAASQTSSSPAAAPSDSSYRVRRGDSLSLIASRYADSSAEVRRWMLVAYRSNPSAFDGNMNLLRSGSVLRVPDTAAVASVSPEEALTEVRRQYAAWRDAAPAPSPAPEGPTAPAPAPGPATPAQNAGRLRLVPPTTPAAAGGAPTPSATTAAALPPAQAQELEGRVRELQAQLEESRRLLETRNAELAQLQARLSDQSPDAAAAPADAGDVPGEASAPSAAAEQGAEPAQAPAAAATPAVAAAPAESEAQRSWLDTVKEFWWALALALAALAALLGLRAWRARQAAAFDDSLGRLAGSTEDTITREDVPPVRKAGAQLTENPFQVHEAGAPVRARREDAFAAGDPAGRSRSGVPPAHDDTISSDTAVNLEQGDALAEADFHMAYGLYDQAADLVRIAIAREPERRDLKLKLLEVFFVWGNKEQFLETARELANSRAQAAPGEWEKIRIMGKQIAPEDPLFASSGATMTTAALSDVDLDLQSGAHRIDFDLASQSGSTPGPSGVDLDIGSAFADNESTRETLANTDRNLAFDADTILSQDNPLDSPTAEQPALQGQKGPSIRQKVDEALKQNRKGVDQTAELAIDDLGFDLGALDTMDQPGLGLSSDAPILLAGMDDESRDTLEEAERRRTEATQALAPNSPTGPWQFGAEDLESAQDESPTSRLTSITPGPRDFDSSHYEATTAVPMYQGEDPDTTVATTPDVSYTAATQQLPAETLRLPDLEPATMSEVGTKLDLARAYMDMGDPDGARNILSEVLQEGTVVQKQEAQRLIDSLPG